MRNQDMLPTIANGTPASLPLTDSTLPTPPAPLAIVGIGCLFPKAAAPGFYWANIKKGVDCIAEVPPTHWNPDDYFNPDPKQPDMTYARRGGFLDVVDFNPLEFGIAPRDIEATDTTQLLGLVAAKQALVDAGILAASAKGESTQPRSAVDRSRISVILGVTGTLELVIPLGARLGHPKWKRAMKAAGIPDELANDAAERIAESYVPWQENSFPGLLGNVVAGRIANRLDLGGTNCVVDAACASSLSAVHLAALELQAHRADVVVTGGCDTFNDIFMYMCFSKTPALSPTGDAKPFDANGDGTILGEGLGMVVLKRLSDAERDGDTIYAILKGIGSSSDGKGNAIYAPSAAGQKNCLRNAYALANVTPDTIELVEAHGTGTKVGDATEATALTEVYSKDAASSAQSPISRPWCALGSVKSQVGHTKAAAGAASLIKATLALYFKVLPPTIKVTKPVEPLGSPDSPFYVNTAMRPWLPRAEHPRRAALSAFGFGGSNFHAVLEEHRSEKVEVDWDGSVEILALGAETAEALVAELEKVPTSWPEFARYAERSRTSFAVSARCRLCFSAHRSLTDLQTAIAGAVAKLTADPASTGWHTSDGAHYGSGPVPGKLAVLFPGQGSQSVGMLRELACLFPEMLDSLAAANAAIQNMSKEASDTRRLSDRIYPPSSFNAEQKKLQDADLRETQNAQPALGAVSFGAWRLLSERFGVVGDMFAGHSYGELVALTAANRIASADLWSLSRLRGLLMGEQRTGDRGSMLAVLAPLEDVERVISKEKLDLTIANKNAPKQNVLSGATSEIERAEKSFTESKMKTARLPVAAAFHSPFVAEAAIPFRAALETVNFASASAPVYANTTAAEYPDDSTAARDLLAHQLAKPVAFVEQIQALFQAGAKTFVEIGPGSVLSRMTEAILSEFGGSNFEVFALDRSAGKRSGVLDLSEVLARLAARGHRVNLAAWEMGSRCRPSLLAGKPGHTIALNGANYVNPRPLRPATPPKLLNGRHTPATIQRSVSSPSHARVALMSDSDPNALAQALLMTQQSLASLQRMQEQTAALHKQFLESQEAAQRTIQALIDQQQSLLLSGLGSGVALPTVPRLPTTVPATAIVPPPVVAPPRPTPPVAPSRFIASPPAPTITPPPAALPKPASVSANARTSTATKVPSGNGIATTLLAVVAEKTGYPVESLGLELSLDADLGVDSIKRVEILSTLQERLPGAPVVKPEHLGTLHTLRDVADFLSGSNGALADDEDELIRTMPVTREQLLLLSRPDDNLQVSGSRTTQSIAPIPAAPVSSLTNEVSHILLQVVAEKTGYPLESLDLDLTLDSDLGVDSIKRVEILSTLQERLPGAPVVKPEHLGTLHSLRDVAEFLEGQDLMPLYSSLISGPETAKIPIMPHVPPAPEAGPFAASEASRVGGIESPDLLAPDTEQVSSIHPPILSESVQKMSGGTRESGIVRHPVPRPAGDQTVGTDRVDRSILQPVDLDLQTPRAQIPLATGGEIWVVGNSDPLTKAVVDRLTARDFNTKVFGWSGPGTVKPGGPLTGLVLIAPVAPGPESGLNRQAFEWLKVAGSKLRQAGRSGAAVFATVARLDGAFGLAELSPEADPTAGGLAGLVKTARHEWPEVSCKAIDLAARFEKLPSAAVALVDEILAAGPVEVGIASTHRCTLELARTVRRAGNQLINLGSRDVILITGGARGVTAEAVVALAETYSSTLILTGRTPTPVPEPEWLAGLTGESELKAAIAAKLGPDAGPKQVGEQYHKTIAQREVRRTLERITRAGAKAAYFPVNITDGKAVADLLQQVRVKFGPVTALVHGAGVLADRRIDDLTSEQFDNVYSTKVDGLRNLLELLANEDLKAIVLFSSTTARLGRIGQAAYACANEVLNKTAQVEGRRRSGCKVVSINWGPWDGGMVTPGLRKMFENEGIGLIPLADGGIFLLQELNAIGKSIEVVALGKHRGSGVVPVPAGTGSGSSSTPAHRETGAGSSPSMALSAEFSLAFDRMVDLSSHPVLAAHVIDGRAVLPMALHLEWLAHAALHGNPGLVFHGFNDLRITQAVHIDAGASIQIRAFAEKATKQDKFFVVTVELRGKRKDGRELVHSRAEIVLVSALPTAPLADQPPPVAPLSYSVPEAYRELLFHGQELQGIERIDGASETAFIGTAFPAPMPNEWFQSPLRSGWVAEPLVLDSSFQMMILWTCFQHNTGSLPCFAGRYRQYRKAFPADPTTIVIRIRRDDGKFARADVDYLDPDGRIIAQMQDYECVMEKTLSQAFRRNQIGAKR
jgi:acyl transferase domain-containing protein/NAD(P)-dependent dehydrogenase (short-subunit alcohol dehydrogenase family)/acyl carrier protein